MSWLRSKNGGSEVEVKDFFEEHKRLRAERASSQSEHSASAPPKHSRKETSLGSQAGASTEAPQSSPLEALIAGLRTLGYDTKQLEALKEYAAHLDEEERRLNEEIQQRQRRLEVIRSARELLRRLGV